jgi:hypothetical protein
MSTLSLRLPESLHKRLAELAQREGISINQLIATAVAEKMSALDTEDLLKDRAGRGSRARFLAALAKVRDVEALPGDELGRATPKKRGHAVKRSTRKAG